MGKPSAPPPPDYVGAAQAQGAADKATAQYNTAVQRPTQITPYGQQSWTLKPGVDPNNPQPGDWTVTNTLDPVQQKILDANNQTSLGLSGLEDKGLGYVSGQLDKPFDASQITPINGDQNALRQQVLDAINQRAARAQEQDLAALRARLLNQGVAEGSAAYNDALRQYQSGINDFRLGAQTNADSQVQNAFQRGLAAQQQDIQRQSFMRNEPINTLNAVRTGAQIQNPSFQSWGSSNTQAPPIYQATQDQYKAAMDAYNAKMAGSSGFFGGLASLGGQLGSAAITASDRRLKKWITRLGATAAGIPIYLYSYLWDAMPHIGVMAQDVAAARVMMPNGFWAVDYSKVQ